MDKHSPAVGRKLQKHLAEIFHLWDELSDLGVNQSQEALTRCMERICGWLAAQDAFWVGAVHVMDCPTSKRGDALSGWRIRSVQPLNPQLHELQRYNKIVKEDAHEDLELGATSITLAAGAGRFRAYTLQSGELVDLKTFKKTAHYDFYYRQADIFDRIWVVVPVSADTESYFCFDRIGRKRRFSADDLELASFALRGIKWFHRQLMLHFGLGLCTDPITPAERQIIQGLLTGAAEREIALETNLSPGTVHQYATRIYQKFGVRGRKEFMALWLSGNTRGCE